MGCCSHSKAHPSTTAIISETDSRAKSSKNQSQSLRVCGTNQPNGAEAAGARCIMEKRIFDEKKGSWQEFLLLSSRSLLPWKYGIQKQQDLDVITWQRYLQWIRSEVGKVPPYSVRADFTGIIKPERTKPTHTQDPRAQTMIFLFKTIPEIDGFYDTNAHKIEIITNINIF